MTPLPASTSQAPGATPASAEPPSDWRAAGSWAALAAFGVAAFEMLFMISPFAAYFYGAYTPVLGLLQGSATSAWLADFYLSHLSEPRSVVLDRAQQGGGLLFLGGLALFLVHAAHLYWMKFVRKGVATRLLYAYVRHPQYLCLMASGLGLALAWPRFLNIYLWLGLLGAYHVLARDEERRMERLHGEAYRAYRDSRPMFLPGGLEARLSRPSPGRLGRLAGLALLLATPWGLRAWSLSRLPHLAPDPQGRALIVALDLPKEVPVELWWPQIARKLPPPPDEPKTLPVYYLVADHHRLWHLLIDSGAVREKVRLESLPQASLYVLRARASRPCRRGPCTALAGPEAAAHPGVLRRPEAVHYLLPPSWGLSFAGFPLPPGTFHRHASAPVL